MELVGQLDAAQFQFAASRIVARQGQEHADLDNVAGRAFIGLLVTAAAAGYESRRYGHRQHRRYKLFHRKYPSLHSTVFEISLEIL